MTKDSKSESIAGDQASPSSGMTCPICDQQVDPKHPNAPFCSGRCRLVDLGNWMKGDYVISRDIKESDLDDAE
jgi:hypothetical protein